MNTREQAILFWIGIVIIGSLIYGIKNRESNNLKSILDVFKYTGIVLVNPVSLITLLFNFLYIFLIYFGFYKKNINISFWYIKDYLVVLFFSVYPIMMYLKKVDFKKLIHEKSVELLG